MDASELSVSKTSAPASTAPGAPANLPAPGVGNYNNDTATVAAVQKKLTEGAAQSQQMTALIKSFGSKKTAAEKAKDAKTVALIGKLDPKRTDGVFDENTANALKAAQQMGGVPATGIIDDWVLAGMEIPKPKSSGSFAAFMTKKYASVPVYGWAVIGTVVVISAGYFIKKGKR
jgi:ribosomal protein S16